MNGDICAHQRPFHLHLKIHEIGVPPNQESVPAFKSSIHLIDGVGPEMFANSESFREELDRPTLFSASRVPASEF